MRPDPSRGRLQIFQDLRFTRRSWAVERAGAAALYLFLLGGLLGFFGGSGPLSRAKAVAASGSLRLEYDRFAHFESGSVLRVRVRPDAAGNLELWIAESYLREIRLEGITPTPAAVRFGEGRQI